MEEVLSQIITCAASNNLVNIKKSAQEALDLLWLQQGLIRDPAHELREKCLKVVQLCLETKKSKFVSLAINSCHRLLRDDRFHSNFELEDDTKWLLGQLLQATSSFPLQTDDTQVDILKVFLNLACGNVWNMNGRLVIAVLTLFSEAFESGNAAVRAGSQAAASQTLRSFVSQLEEEWTVEDTEVTTFNDIIPIMQFLCSRIDCSESAGRCEHGMLFLLECLLTVISCLPNFVRSNPHLRQLMWQKLTPALISVLGSPKVDKYITTRDDSDTDRGRGRGSGCLAAAPTFSTLHARTVYSICAELVRVVGPVSAVRPMLESLFHRMLLYPSPVYRLDALRATAELLRNPLRLLDIAGPLLGADNQSCDMALVRLIMDSIEDCRKGDLNLISAAVDCCTALLDALLELCKGSCLPPAAVEGILRIWPNLHECEYSGPTYYESVTRLPTSYQDRIQLEKEGHKNDGDDSDTSGVDQNSDCSGETEGPQSCEVDDVVSEIESVDRVAQNLSLGILDLPIGLGDSERQHARHFIGALHDLLSTLQPMWGMAQLDQALQTFASQYCQGVIREQPITEWGIIVNADGIYLTTVSALFLDLRLYKDGYYSEPGLTPLLTEDEFVEEVQGSGVLVYLSGTWIREVYQAVVSGSLLRAHGYFASDTNTHSLINLLLDIGGLGTRQQGSEMLWESRRLEVAAQSVEPAPEVGAGLRLARLLLTCSWQSLLLVLAAPLSLKPGRGKKRQQALRDTVSCSLNGLQVAAKLCSLLGVQDRCDLILEHLSAASCSATTPRRLLSQRDSQPRLTVAAALSLELILEQGLELGSHCPACWPHVFRTVRAVRKLEKAAFNSAAGLDVAVAPPGMAGQETLPQDDDEVDVYSFLRSSNGELVVSKYLKSVGYVDTLTPTQTANVLTLLCYMSVELIMDAAYKLNLRALENFARALCSASRYQLFPPTRKRNVPVPPNWMQKLLPSQDSSTPEPYLLDSVGELMVKSARSSRPLAHVMRLWGVIGPHLTEAACHSDPAVCKKAVELIEAAINTHIKQGAELPYFHFNEALFKPFENLLCLELCENEVQDQIVSCICEFVEGSASEVRSGWRALFGALRSVPSSATFLDVFQLFLDTKNPLVFCSAAVDCILCLLKHVRSSSAHRRTSCLQFLQRCEDVLAAVWAMPQPLVFQAAHRIHISDGLLVEVDSSEQLVPFEVIPEDLDFATFSYAELAIDPTKTKLTLENMDRPSGVLRVWFLLLEGLYSAAIAADTDAQPPLLDAVFADILGLTQRTDPEFGIFCINRLLLPATQTWVRQCVREGSTALTGPKQALGLLSDLCLSCYKQHRYNKNLENELELMLKQLLLILVECASCPSLATSPPACFRHVLMNIGHMFTPEQWRVASLALRRSFEVTLTPLRQILMAFNCRSLSFYGDYDQVKVAARRDSTIREIIQLKYLAQQVFLLDDQREELKSPAGPPEFDLAGERSYTFLLRPSIDANSLENVRVPVKSLVTVMLAHQSLLQVVATVLLHGSAHFIPSLANVLFASEDSEYLDSALPGLMGSMETQDVLVLLDCLDLAYKAALQFDARPGLKFLVQKVIGLERAANLYRLAGAAWAVKLVVLFELCLYHIKRQNYTVDDIKKLQSNPDDDSEIKVYMTRLQENFDELCETYIDLVQDADGTHSAVDKVPDQPILFLNACQDEEISPIQPRKSESEGLVEDMKNKLKPFQLSDFVDTISASTSAESELEFADSDEEEEFKHDERDEVESKGENVEVEEETNGKDVETKEEAKGEIVEVKDANSIGHENEVVTSLPEEEAVVKEDEASATEVHEEDSVFEIKKPQLTIDSSHVEKEDESDAISAALSEYKKRKQQHCPEKRNNPFVTINPPQVPQTNVPHEIEVQRRNSFLKDSEAHRRVWAEMLGAAFELLSQLSDDEFRTILPILFGGIQRLTAYATDSTLKQSVAEFFSRVALVYGFGSSP